MTINQQELTNYVKAVIEGVQNGIPEDYEIKSTIDFELAVINTKEAKGGINILVADGKGKYEKESISKIKFSVGREELHVPPMIVSG